jgi:hypothetical protein
MSSFDNVVLPLAKQNFIYSDLFSVHMYWISNKIVIMWLQASAIWVVGADQGKTF